MRLAKPRFATRRHPERKSDGPQVRVISKALGRSLMPWQQYVSDVATEHDPNNPGRWAYDVVIVSVPRQCGKTTLLSHVMTQRSIAYPNHQAFFTAQTRLDAVARWRDLIKDVKESPLKNHVTTRYSGGSEKLAFPNGSELCVFAPKPEALHGYHPALVAMDEIWVLAKDEGEAMMAAIVPAQSTLGNRQLWLISTMGTPDSGFMNSWVELGRQAVNDPASRIAYFEWSADPDDPPYEPATWWKCHPALGNTIDEDTIRKAAETLSRGEFERAYLNRLTQTLEPEIPAEVIARVLDPDQERPVAEDQLTLTFEVAADSSRASIALTWIDRYGVAQSRIAMGRAGYLWLPAEIHKMRNALGSRRVTVAADGGGPSRSTIARLQAGSDRYPAIDVQTLNAGEFASACMDTLAWMDEGTLRVGPSTSFQKAAAAVVTKPMAGGRAWDRTGSKVAIDALIAVTVGAAIAGATKAEVKPAIYV